MRDDPKTAQPSTDEKQETDTVKQEGEIDTLPEEDVISLDEFDEFDKKQDIPGNSSTNEGGIYPPEEAFDQDSPNYEAGTPGHPGIDEGTA